MDRREFFQKSVIASITGAVLADSTLARAQQAPAGSAATPVKLVLDADTRNFQWLRTADQVAQAAIEVTYGGVMPVLGPAPAHVDMDKVSTDLPAFVNTIRKHGLRVKQLRGGPPVMADASVQALVGTMGQLGMTHYSLDTDNYDLTRPIMPQLDAMKARVDHLVKLNQKNGATVMFRTRADSRAIGSAVWDLLYVLKDFDPRYVGLDWDTGQMSQHAGTWELLLRTAGPYIAGVSWNDRAWTQRLDAFTQQTGPYPGPQPQGAAAGGGRGGPAGAPGAPPEGPAAGGRGGGRGGRGAAAGGAPASATAPAPAGRGGGRGGNLDSVPRPLSGNSFARGGTWTTQPMPMGTGFLDIFKYAQTLHDIGFNGVTDLQAEYPLGGSETGADKITLPRIMVLGGLKHDVLTVRAAVGQSGTGMTL